MFMKLSYCAVVTLALMSGCASLPSPTVAGEGRYLIMSAAGSPMAQIDARDEATCKTMGNSAVKRNPNMAGLTRCENRPVDGQLPYMAVVRNTQMSVDITSRYRTEELCNTTLATMDPRGTKVIRSCAKAN
jgi:uncharacterized protein YceK